MSLLARLKSASGQKRNCLMDVHPFAKESLEFRLQYLSAIALAVAIDREPKKSETQAFLGLASNLSVEKADAEEQLSERANLTEDDIIVLFESLSDKNANLHYMIDLTWIHAIDGSVDENEQSTTEHLGQLLEITSETTRELNKFMVSLRNANYIDLYSSIRNLFGDQNIRDHLVPILKKFIPYQDFIYNRWIDHGNNEITDCATGVTWYRHYIKNVVFCFGEKINQNSNDINNRIERFSLSSSPIKKWRAPTTREFSTIKDLGYFEQIFNEKVQEKNTLTKDGGYYDSLRGLSWSEHFHLLLVREDISWLKTNIDSDF